MGNYTLPKALTQDPSVEYWAKCEVIAYFAREVDPLRFIEEHISWEPVVVVLEHGESKVLKLLANEFRERLQFLFARQDCYISYNEYFKGWYSVQTLKAIHAFVVDVDHVPPDLLEWWLKVVMPKMRVKPTYVYASGEGTQFIYVLAEPLQFFKRHKAAIQELYFKLQYKFIPLASVGEQWGYSTKIDVHTVTQSYRLPGSLSKLGIKTKIFRYGEIVDPKELLEWLNVKLEPKKTAKKINKLWLKGVDVIPRAYGGRTFYNYAYERAMQEVMPGHRYLTMFALAVIAWKCQVPIEELKRDLESLVLIWKGRPDHKGAHPMQAKEIYKALKGYNPKATLVSCDTLEEWMGIQLRKKRMSKQEQIEKVFIPAGTAARQRKKQERMQQVVELRKQGLSWSKIGRRLGISRRRAIQLYQEAFTP